MAMEKTFNAAEAEDRIYKAWEDAGAFKAGANASRPETFSIVIPPPNVTGSLHMGHAFNNTLQDILVRWKRMQGYDTLWQPGTDHAGIATQMVTERDMAAKGEPTRAEMGRDAFINRVWQQKVESRGTIIGQLKRLGASCDWSREAFTMGGAAGDPDKGTPNAGPNFHDAVIKVFVEMYNKGLIYRGKRLVNWDPHFETAISDLEVENIETPGHMWHFKYPLAGGATYTYVEKDEDGNITLEEERDYISIATTRPETMLGDGAVAVHPDDERYAPIVGQLCEIPVGPKEHRRLIPIITDEYPDPDFGSGAVKITGAHDFNDYGVAKRANIPCYRLMNRRGAMRSDGFSYEMSAIFASEILEKGLSIGVRIDDINLVPDAYRGMDRFEARKAVVADITAEGLAVMELVDDPDFDGDENAETSDARQTQNHTESRHHCPTGKMWVPMVENKLIMQPFGDRSKVVIEPMLTDQWFVDAAKIVGPALDVVRDGKVKILPDSGEKVYFNWLENIEPWCISRQLWWGHQIPVWYGSHIEEDYYRGLVDITNSETGFEDQIGDAVVFCLENETDVVEAARAYYASIIGEDVIVKLLTFEEAYIENHLYGNFYPGRGTALSTDPETNKKIVTLYRDIDVLDTWFSSGLWPIGTLGWPDNTPELQRYFPTSTLVTGQDIIFFWVARMMMMQLAVVDEIPFDTIYLHGLVRDAKGQKMSKSIGNVIDPLDIIDEFGADALRFTNAAMASLGGALKLDKQRIAGYRNFSTKLWNACRFAEMNDAFGVAHKQPAPSAAVNRWIMGETAITLADVNASLENYRFNDAADALYKFVWGKVCDWYVELSKPLLQGDNLELKVETQATMSWVLDQCLILLHPMMPFITEDLWNTSGQRETMLIHADWPSYSTDLVDENADAELNWVITFIEAVRSARAQMNVPAGLYIPVVSVNVDAHAQAALDANEALIKRLARIDSITAMDDAPKGAIAVNAGTSSFALPLKDVIDVDKEKGRLEKNLSKLEKEIKGLEGRVNNPKFAASAPPEVVDEAKANLADRLGEADVVRTALARLAEI
ncbi:valine--tRNA ligase [Nereida sp. MMG025]|uniref:valine--tRNA ligase n=1 Tax=Nereida sp. MMG025 TaxID=2909981 RepID=UPI001F027761|nr:valine--tRNA ligase [Nereida sp. MMG025]MCF6445079.1 valine--tRNA ligase [Nereida sp. MMG025]